MDEFSTSIPMTVRRFRAPDWLGEAHRIARREVRDAALAEDVAQTALHKLFELDSAPRNIPAWLTTAIQRLAIDHHRRKDFRAVDPHEDLNEHAGQRTISSAVVNRAEIADVLFGLTDRQRQLLLLSADGYTNAEIAEELGFASAASVAVTLSRLRLQLRERRLADQEVQDTFPPVNSSKPVIADQHDHSIHPRVMERIRQDPPENACVPDGWTPVVSFGNQPAARVATVSINPSTAEFEVRGRELDGPQRRFETLASLGIDSLAEADDAAVRKIWDRCLHYFTPSSDPSSVAASANPYRGWFDPLNSFIKTVIGVEPDYYRGTACHLDLVQWPTQPLWSNLKAQVKRSLVERDKDFLLWQLSNPVLEVVYLNGGSACAAVGKVIPLERRTALFPNENSRWAFVHGRVGNARVIGASPYLQNFHVRKENRQDFLDWVAKECREDLAVLDR